MSKILVACTDELGVVKVVGRGSFQNSGCFKAFYLQLLKEGVTRFIVDLSLCSYLDSTFLGTLLGLGLKLRGPEHGRLTVLNASVRNLELLRNLGLDRLIEIGSGPLSGDPEKAKTGTLPPVALNGFNGEAQQSVKSLEEAGLKDLECLVPTRAEAGPTILEAHEALMEFDPRNVPKFKDVVEFLREDLGQSATRP